MTSPEAGRAPSLVDGASGAPFVPAGPCAPVRAQVDSRCADAERLALAARSHQQALADARREHAEIVRLRDGDSQLRDRRRMAENKTEAQSDYRQTMLRASDQGGVQHAAATWLTRIDQLNRRAREADDRADVVAQRVTELERTLPRLELAADAARISAEAAQVVCMEARRALAACEEETQRRPPPVAASASGATTAVPPWAGDGAVPAQIPANPQPSAVDPGTVSGAARALMQGDRQTLLGLALRLAEETGYEAGRLQLLLLELREQVTSKALDELALGFPPGHPFWSQFTTEAAREVAASLLAMGYRFDGRDGWADGRSPQIRDLGLALSYSGYDPRSLRRPAGQAALDGLWRGTTVRSEEYLLSRAPNLTLNEIVALLGSPSGRLGELWDIWGRVRPLLMRAG